MRTRSALIGSLLVAVLLSLLSALQATTATGSTGSGGSFVPVTATLLADTKTGLGLSSQGTVPAGGERTVQITGRGGVPATGVSAVVLDFSAESNVNSALYAFPAEVSRELAILSISGQEERAANTAIVRVGASGKIKVANAHGNTDFNVGVQGYFTTSSDSSTTGGFVPIQPERMVRSDTGVGMSVSPLQGGTQYTIQLAGKNGIPADATAVFANFRIRNSDGSGTGRGGLRIGPSNTTISMNNTSVLDYQKGLDADSGLAVKLGPDGKAKVLITSGTTADLLVDVQGYFTAGTEGGSFTPQDNKRIWDSRNSAGGILKPKEERQIQIAGTTGIPRWDAGAVAATVTALDWTASGYLSVFNSDNPDGTNGTSNLSFEAPLRNTSRQTTSIVAVSEDGKITIRNGSPTASVHVLLNTQGWFTAPVDEEPVDPMDEEPVEPFEPPPASEGAYEVSTVDPESGAVDVFDPTDPGPSEDPSTTSNDGQSGPTIMRKSSINWNTRCGADSSIDNKYEVVISYKRNNSHRRHKGGNAKMYCGKRDSSAHESSFGLRHIRFRHLNDFAKLAALEDGNWGNFMSWTVGWSLQSPDRRTVTKNRFCYEKKFSIMNSKGQVAAVKWVRVYLGSTGVRIMTAHPAGQSGCKGDKF